MAERKKIASGIHEGVKKTSVQKGSLSIPKKLANESIKSFIARLQAYDARRLTPGGTGSNITRGTDTPHPTGRNPVPREPGVVRFRRPTVRVTPGRRTTSQGRMRSNPR